LARTTQRYIAVIADMVRSRDVPASRRRGLQKRFSRLIVNLNQNYRRTIASKFVITLGDEFQGLLNSAASIPDLIWHLEQDFPERELRLGIGFGTLDTPLQNYAINVDGPVLHAARAAIEHARKTKALGGEFRDFGDLDDILNGIARLLWFQRSRWTSSQRSIASLLRQGMSQTQVAEKLRIRRQVVSRQVLAAGCFQYFGAENAWRMILEKQVDPLLGSKQLGSKQLGSKQLGSKHGLSPSH
jgi:SatD family (SatD)